MKRVKRRSSINEETMSAALGPVELDVEMARSHGWTEQQILRCWKTVSEASLRESKAVAKRRGHTRKCEVCECWTVPKGPCHLCQEDAAQALVNVVQLASMLAEPAAPNEGVHAPLITWDPHVDVRKPR